MATYGGYETVEQLARDGCHSLWSARPAGRSGPAAYIIKLHEPTSDMPAAEAQRSGARLLVTAVVQAHVAETGSQHWVPIVASGWAQSTAYFVSHRYTRTLGQLTEEHPHVDAADLQHLAGRIVDGLIELRDTCQRGHGNLKGSNVLLSGPNDLARTHPLLADVAPEAPADWSTDRRGLGLLLYQLVMHEQAAPAAGQPLPAGKRWSRLGSGGENWRRFVERLLTASGDGPFGLESLREEIDRLRPGKRTWVGATAAIVVLAAVLGGAGWKFFVPGSQGRPRAFPALEWLELGIWRQNALAPLMAAGEPAWTSWAAKDASLAELHRLILQASKEHLAIDGAGAAGENAAAAWFTDVEVAKAVAAQRRTNAPPSPAPPRWVTAMEQAQQALARSSGERRRTLAAHPAARRMLFVLEDEFPRQLRASAEGYRARGWMKAAGALETMADAVGQSARGLVPRPAGQTALQQIEQVVATKIEIARLEIAYSRLGQLEDRIATAGHKGVLSRFGEVVAADLAGADAPLGQAFFSTMAQRIAHADEVARGLLPYVEYSRCDGLREVLAAWQPPSPLTLATFETDWPQAAVSPWATRAPADGRTTKWAADVAHLQHAIAQGLERLGALNDRPGRIGLSARYGELESALAELCARPASKESADWIRARADKVREDLAALKADVDARIAWNTLDPQSHPLAAWDWRTQVQTVSLAIDQVPAGEQALEFRRRLESIEQDLLRQMSQSQSWTRGHQNAIELAVAEDRQQLNALAEQVGQIAPPAGGASEVAASGAAGPDPRGSAWATAVAEARRRITERIGELADIFDDAASVRRYEARLVEIDAQTAQLNDKALTWTPANQQRIGDGAGAVASGLTQLEQDLDRQLALDGTDVIDRQARLSWTSQVLEQYWNRQIAAMAQAQLPVAAFKARAAALGELARQLDALPASADAAPVRFRAALGTRINARRELAVAAALAAVQFTPADGSAPATDAQAWEPPQKRYVQWYAEAARLLADMKMLDDKLNMGLGLEDTATAELARKWAGRPLYKEFAADMPDLAKALEHLEKIAAGKLSFGELVTVGEDPAAPLAVALAAWRRLEAASGAKPADADQLYHERAVQVTLRSMIRIRIADPDRRTALLNELASSGQAGPAAAQRASGAGEPGPVKTESGQAEPAAKTVPVATVENSPGQ